MDTFITSSLLRKAVEHHKTTDGDNCIFAVAKGPGGTRFLGRESRPRPNEQVDYLDRCPVCGQWFEKDKHEPAN
jgi:hypothetical protein